MKPSFPFEMIVSSCDPVTGKWSKMLVRGTESGRPNYDGDMVRSIQLEDGRPERATWGCLHPGHPASTWNPWFDAPRFAYGGVWYDSLDAWAAAWGATITERVAL